MHYLPPPPPPTSPMKAQPPEDDTVQKETISFSVCVFFFLETKLYMWTILTLKCVWLCLFFLSFRTLLLAVVFSSCNNILDITVRLMDSVT